MRLLKTIFRSRTAKLVGALVASNLVLIAATVLVGQRLIDSYERLVADFEAGQAQELLDVVVDRMLWREHVDLATTVAADVAQDGAIAKMLAERHGEALEARLQDHFGHQAISSGELSALGFQVVDTGLDPVAAAWRPGAGSPPAGLLAEAAGRDGVERLQPFVATWHAAGAPRIAVMVPIGGLRLRGYVVLHLDPVPVLSALGQVIGQRISVLDLDGARVLAEDDSLAVGDRVTREQIMTVRAPSAEVLARLRGERDIGLLAAELASTRSDALMRLLLVMVSVALATVLGFGLTMRRVERGERAAAEEAARARAREEELRREREEEMQRRREAEDEALHRHMLALAGELESRVATVAETARANVRAMAASAGQMSAMATDAAGVADSARGSCEEAAATMVGAASAMEELRTAGDEVARQISGASEVTRQTAASADDANRRVDQLAAASEQIAEVVQLIEAIASQTSLLALNATIEAARAGEAGRGFAVVASEVKSLSQRTAEATADIGERVRAIREGSTSAISALRDIAGRVHEINASLAAVASASEQRTAFTAEIARSIGTAEGATGQIARDIGEAGHGIGETRRAAGNVEQALGALAEEIESLHARVGEVVAELRRAA